MGNILWLASYPKSGNTWLRAFLANLVVDQSTPLKPNELSEYGEAEASAERYTEVSGRPSTTLAAEELAALRLQVHALIAQRAQGTRLVKTHNFNGSFQGHPLVNWQVTAGAIYVVRNPLDVAVSMTHHFGVTVDAAVDRLGDDRVVSINDTALASDFICSWSTHVKSWADMAERVPGKIIVLRYEDLLERPAKNFAKAAKLIGLGKDKARVARAIAHARFQTLSALEKKHGFVETVDEKTNFFRRGCANQWREALNRDQVERIVHDHREQMLRFRYMPAGY
ncbi:MAG: sulfotransferase domain-containing protein [Rhodanobacteraceae bacterium]|nr:MAG: sulfotransferase domain-containing protein [Rhodanobacteraceae bacterium]